MFDVDDFVSECVARAPDGSAAVEEVLRRAMSDSAAIQAVFGAPTSASLGVLYSGTDLTVLNAVWAPRMVFPPHDHRTWGVIGIYAGQEDNVFYRRTATTIERTAAREVKTGEIVVLGEDVIHLVENPLDRSFTGGIHLYGGDYINNPRSIWDTDTLREGPATFSQSQSIFARANEDIHSSDNP
jgi:predicted metal-dependent enzyme (double-stranded beta helix superfamily)